MTSLEQEFRNHFGREINEPAKQEVLKAGDPNCQHSYIFYEDNAFDGQAWWCDIPGCGRHERMNYSPGSKIKFPVNALISTPNPKYGAEKFYAFRADSAGMAELLSKWDWVKRER